MCGNDQRRDGRWLWPVCLLAILVAGSAARAEDCSNGNFASTYALIEKVIFETRGCTEMACHGSQKMGGLDLRPGNYDALMGDALTVEGWKRVYPGRRDLSLLFINVAAKLEGSEYKAPLRSMPLGDVPAITNKQLEALRKWIEAGAPKDGVVDGTAELLDACLPPPEPIAIAPLPPPAAGTGVQFTMARVEVPPHYENEGCFVSYYDVSDQVPDKYKSADGKSFRFKRNEVRQDPLSHHLIVSRYAGNAPANDPQWGTFECRGGTKPPGTSCDPTDLTFCGEGICATEFQQSVACIGFGPLDNNLGIQNAGFAGIQETAAEFRFPEGVYRELPLKGTLIWNTHHFNVSDKPGKVEAWLNFEFVEPEDAKYPALTIFDATDIFWGKCKNGMGSFNGCGAESRFQHPVREVEAFKTYEACSVHTLPQGAHLYELSSHAHRHMKRWRTFLGAFRCQGGAANGEPCSPVGYDMVSPEVCKGSPCVAMEQPKAGDCNYDKKVVVDEVMTGVQIALGQATVEDCPDADSDSNAQVAIDDLVKSASAATNGMPPAHERDAMDSLMYVSHVYNDPTVVRLDEAPLIFKSPDPDQRSLTYCGLYDNGYNGGDLDPTFVKKKSTSPSVPNPLAPGGPCDRATHCTAGKVGEPCSGALAAIRHASCDSFPDATPRVHDGVCDACPVVGGVTTEDEMFILLGGFWIQ